MPVTLINAFEVPPEADEAFIAGWQRARDFLATRDGFSTTALHRALREDTALRFVNVARVDSPEVWQRAISDPGFPGGRMPFTAHPSLYEVVREDGEPGGEGGVVLINPFEVPPGEDERFLARWERARDALAARPGYLGTRLHRSLAPDRLPLRERGALVEPAHVRPVAAAARGPGGRRRRRLPIPPGAVRGGPWLTPSCWRPGAKPEVATAQARRRGWAHEPSDGRGPPRPGRRRARRARPRPARSPGRSSSRAGWTTRAG